MLTSLEPRRGKTVPHHPPDVVGESSADGGESEVEVGRLWDGSDDSLIAQVALNWTRFLTFFQKKFRRRRSDGAAGGEETAVEVRNFFRTRGMRRLVRLPLGCGWLKRPLSIGKRLIREGRGRIDESGSVHPSRRPPRGGQQGRKFRERLQDGRESGVFSYRLRIQPAIEGFVKITQSLRRPTFGIGRPVVPGGGEQLGGA